MSEIQILPSSNTFSFFTTFGTTLSLIFSIGLIFPLRAKKSNYSRIMRHILISESIFIFSELLIVTGHEIEEIGDLFCKIYNCLTFNLFLAGDPKCYNLQRANISAYFGNQAFSMILNIFICLEIVLILKNPISQLKSRLKPYYLISTISGLIVFFITYYTVTEQIEKENYSLTNLFMSIISVYINLVIYFAFLIFGFISTMYLIFRFCIGQPFLKSLKNWFVIRHLIYVILYSLCFLPLKINEFLVITNNQNYLYLELGIVINCFMGFLMFLIRVTETNFYDKLCCLNKEETNLNPNDSSNNLNTSSKDNEAFFDSNQPLTSVISRNMNLEFMCCILFGLTEIFMKPERKNKLSLNNSKDISYTFGNSNVQEKSLLTGFKNISGKDFTRAKSHKIRYKKIFSDDMDFDKLEVEVRTFHNEKIKFNENNPQQDFNDTESHQSQSVDENISHSHHDAIIIEYCSRVFRELRKLDDITGYELERSLNPTLNQEGMNKIRESEGKSGSFFFFSHDNKFIIKTITNNELKTMLGKFMANYYEHISENPTSLLTRIYGIYSIVIKGVSRINIILMQNLITVNHSRIKRIFDLKGSRVERITKNIERCDKMKALKDLDYLWMIKIDEDMVDFSADHCDVIENTLSNDLKMLREVEVMDYSLLLIITFMPKENDPEYDNVINLFTDRRYHTRIFKSKNQKYLYILGIIDYLQKFNVAKFFENKYKSILYGNQIKYVSAVDPMIYSERMFNFAKDYIFTK